VKEAFFSTGARLEAALARVLAGAILVGVTFLVADTFFAEVLAELFFAVAARTTPGATNTSIASSAEIKTLLKAMLSLPVLSADLVETIIHPGLLLWNLPSTETARTNPTLTKDWPYGNL
jgi:hypothetical protein